MTASCSMGPTSVIVEPTRRDSALVVRRIVVMPVRSGLAGCRRPRGLFCGRDGLLNYTSCPPMRKGSSKARRCRPQSGSVRGRVRKLVFGQQAHRFLRQREQPHGTLRPAIPVDPRRRLAAASSPSCARQKGDQALTGLVFSPDDQGRLASRAASSIFAELGRSLCRG